MGVQKVVVRCEDAEENGGKLDLSGCKLIQVPDALYFMIEERNIEVTACNLSSNVIKKIPPKLPSKFSLITDLEVELISTCESLENLNLEENPLTRDCQDNLSFIAKKQILMTPRELEEWEDLSIEK